MPKVSVVLTSFNHSKYICEAIDSVLNQTFIDFELIIWDDFSTDNSWELINKYTDIRIKAIRNTKNRGAVEGINNAISELANGEYIAIHHSDDVWELDKLEKQVAFLDGHSDIGAVFTRVKIIDEDGAAFLDLQHSYSSVFQQHNRSRFDWLRFFFFHGNCLCHPSVLVRRTTYEVVGLYDRRLAQVPDFDMWIRICLLQEIHILDEFLVKFRVRAGEANQSGRKPETMIRGANEQLLVLRNYLQIESEQDLCEVFPEISMRFQSDSPTHYKLAIYAVETDDCVLQAFGLEILYMLMADERTATELELHGFCFTNLIALSGRCDYFRSNHLFQVESACRALKSDHNALNSELHRIKDSLSWKITKPLRFFMRLASSPKELLIEVRGRLRAAIAIKNQSVLVPFGYPALKWKSGPNLAVICHMFYIDMADEFARYLLKIPFAFDLYITTDTENKRELIEGHFLNWKGKVEIRLAPNRGRDIAPKLITCRDVYDRYEYVLHIHSKKSPHNYRLSRWRYYLLETLLGSTEIVESIFEAFRSSPNLGMIAPRHFEAIHNTAGWGKNFKVAEKLAQRMGVEISRNESIDFPSGSMFWARTAALRPLLDFNLSIDDFPDEVGQVDETLGHAIERLFYFACEKAGYSWLKICHIDFYDRDKGRKAITNLDDLTRLINRSPRNLIK
jgi:hypothetical protein